MEPYKVYVPSTFSIEKYEPELNSDKVKVERDVDVVGEEVCTDARMDEVYRPAVFSIKTEHENRANAPTDTHLSELLSCVTKLFVCLFLTQPTTYFCN
jgi:hypothetical protein